MFFLLSGRARLSGGQLHDHAEQPECGGPAGNHVVEHHSAGLVHVRLVGPADRLALPEGRPRALGRGEQPQGIVSAGQHAANDAAQGGVELSEPASQQEEQGRGFLTGSMTYNYLNS